jgi:N-acetylglucosamine kinase-like BadF-type ATPase
MTHLQKGPIAMPTHVLGVDGGTTKTIALVADMNGQIVGAARGGNSNWTGADVTQPMQVVATTVREALGAAGCTPADIEVGVFGLAGADWPEDYARRQVALEAANLAQRIVVRNDAIAGWRGGTRQTYGAVIAAGTGSNTCILDPDGREWCYGYYVFYGGAVDVAQDALQAVLRAEDGRGRPTALTARVLQHLDFPTPEAMLKAMVAGQIGQSALLSLCPLTFEVAAGGDEVAADLIVKQGAALGEYAAAAIRRFGMQGLAFDVVLAGSVFKGQGPLLIDTVTQVIHRTAPRATIVRAALEPAAGALLLAYDALGIAVTDEMLATLQQTLPDPALFATGEAAPPTLAGLEYRHTTWTGEA